MIVLLKTKRSVSEYVDYDKTLMSASIMQIIYSGSLLDT